MIDIDWHVLATQAKNDFKSDENINYIPKSGARPTTLSIDAKEMGRTKTSIQAGFERCAPPAPCAPLKNEGVGLDSKNNEVKSTVPESGATKKLRAANLHPIAVCLLISVASKMQFSNEEIFNELIKLESMEPTEQIRVWTGYAVKNGIDPLKIVYPFTQSTGKGFDCMNCQHIDMKTAHQPGSRRLYHWSCKKHHDILEGYIGV
jgi:hypothetical protein